MRKHLLPGRGRRRSSLLSAVGLGDPAPSSGGEDEDEDEDEEGQGRGLAVTEAEAGLLDAAAGDHEKRRALLAGKDSSMGSGLAWHLAKVDDRQRSSAALEETKAEPNRERAAYHHPAAAKATTSAAEAQDPEDSCSQQLRHDSAETHVEDGKHSPPGARNLARDVEEHSKESETPVEATAPATDITANVSAAIPTPDTGGAPVMPVRHPSDPGSLASEDVVLQSTSGQFIKVDLALSAPKPEVLQLPEAMWDEMVEVASSCYEKCLAAAKSDSIELFAELAAMTGCMPLAARSDPDVAFMQLLKDIKRESVSVNEELFVGASAFDSLYSALELLLIEHDAELHGIGLEHKVQRLLRSCSRTVSGYDAFEIVSALFGHTDAMVTPAMMDNSPIRVQSDVRDGLITVSSTNVFKLSQQLHDGGLATALVLKTEISEQIEVSTWQTVRWMRMNPLDRAEECLNPIALFRERTLDALLKTQIRSPSPNSAGAASSTSSSSSHEGSTAWEHNKRVLEVLSEARSALDLAISQSTKAIRELTHAEYLRGRQDGLECRTQRMSSEESSVFSAANDPSGRARSPSPIAVVGNLAQEAAGPIAKLLGASESGGSKSH
ncbi:Hypothetical Protein FCC1311_007392 [Hondaea fermentalgiana]|uniref:Uncharacterized protein n=1 Tax=Hondaea fermentalgiana TaxID=2315210 RepID=A0A2R5G0J5_9STRA|nr:Hypothetical Protein FCC1311_007392 [Hondaea fermentalgiana]|eukprot:GBG24520.1 Hypothetical Protein FCC1311_007392 [Hondaea fermentalgiana]